MGVYTSTFPKPGGIKRKIDIRFVPIKSWPTALLHSTGSDEFNVEMRRVALEQGYTLSEHGLFKSLPEGEEEKIKSKKGEKKAEKEARLKEQERKKEKRRVVLKSEAEVFEFLGLKFLEPNERKTGALSKEKVKSPRSPGRRATPPGGMKFGSGERKSPRQ
jgi:DNA polymerase beta